VTFLTREVGGAIWVTRGWTSSVNWDSRATSKSISWRRRRFTMDPR
jgi:hypothetical protein